MKTIEKVKLWISSAGFRSIGYLAGSAFAFVLLGSGVLAGIGIGIFVADNWVTIQELINKK